MYIVKYSERVHMARMHFGFEDLTLGLIASVPSHCLYFPYISTDCVPSF